MLERFKIVSGIKIRIDTLNCRVPILGKANS